MCLGELAAIGQGFGTLKGIKILLKVGLRQKILRMRGQRPLGMGAALVGELMQVARRLEVPLILNCRLQDALLQDGRIVGTTCGHVYLTDPAPYLPPQGLGRPRVRYHSDAHPIGVRKWVKRQPASAWRKKTLRSTTKEKLVVEVLHRRVWLWDRYSPIAHCWHLIVRREIGSPGTVQYSLSNAPAQTSVRKLARMQAQRFWIERAFQDAKSHIGMAQYQARQWPSWHPHGTLGVVGVPPRGPLGALMQLRPPTHRLVRE